MVLVGRKPKSEYIIPDGLQFTTMGLMVIPSNTQKPKYAHTAKEGFGFDTTSGTSGDASGMYSTWKQPTDLEFQKENENDLPPEVPEMDEYPVTVPFSHATPFADGLRTWRPAPESGADLVNNLHAGRWEARAFCRQMDMSSLNTHQGRWENRHMRPKLPNVTPYMHANRWQDRTGAWTKKVEDGGAGGTQGYGVGQGCRLDGRPEGFSLPMENNPESPHPAEKKAFRPPMWGRTQAMKASTTTVEPLKPATPGGLTMQKAASGRPSTEQSIRGWGGTTVLSATHGPFLRPTTVPTSLRPSLQPTIKSGLGMAQKPATLHEVSNGIGEVNPTIVRAGKNRHPIQKTDVTRWEMTNPDSWQINPYENVPPGEMPWFGMRKATGFEKPGVTAPEVMAQIPPDVSKLATLNMSESVRDSTNPHNDPFLVGRQYTYRRAKLEKKLERMTRGNAGRRGSSSSYSNSSSSSVIHSLKELNHATASKLA